MIYRRTFFLASTLFPCYRKIEGADSSIPLRVETYAQNDPKKLINVGRTHTRLRRRITENGNSDSTTTSDTPPAVVISFDETAVDCVNDLESLYKNDDGKVLQDAEEKFLDFFVEKCKEEHDQASDNMGPVLCSFPQPAVSPTKNDYEFVTDIEIDLRQLKGVSPEYDELPMMCSSSISSIGENDSAIVTSEPTGESNSNIHSSFCSVDTFLYIDKDDNSEAPALQQHYDGVPLCVAMDECAFQGDASLNNEKLQKAFIDTCVHLWGGMGNSVGGNFQCTEMARNAAFHCNMNVPSPCSETDGTEGIESSRLMMSPVNQTVPSLPSREYQLGLEKLSRRVQEDCFQASTSDESSYCRMNSRQLPDYRFVLDFFSPDYIREQKKREGGDTSVVNKATELLDELKEKCEDVDGYLCRSDLQFEYDILKFPSYLRGKITIRGYPICFSSKSEDCNGDETDNQNAEKKAEKLQLRKDIVRDVMVWEFVAQLANQLDSRRTKRRRILETRTNNDRQTKFSKSRRLLSGQHIQQRRFNNTQSGVEHRHLIQQYYAKNRRRCSTKQRQRQLQNDDDVYSDFKWRTVKEILPKLPGLNGEDAKKNGGVSAVNRWGPGLCGGNSFDCQATITKFSCNKG